MRELTADGQVRTYRGGSVEALLPQIRAELGSDAVILRQREGLVGGVGGFFQKRCVEVEARPGGPGIDVYDDEADGPRVLSWGEGGSADSPVRTPPPPTPPAAGSVPVDEPIVRSDRATREGLATPAVRTVVEQAEPFAEMLGELGGDEEMDKPQQPRRAGVLRDGLVAAGLGADIAGEVVSSVLAYAMPFANPGRLRTLVRNELALRIPVAAAPGPGPRTIAVVGPAGAGKTTAIAAIAAAHAARGTPVACVAADQLPRRAGPREGDLLLIDTPPLWSGSERLAEIAAALDSLAEPEVHLVLRAGTAAGAGAGLAEGLAGLRPNRLLLTGAAETGHVGGVIDVAIRAGLPFGYVAGSPEEIAPADPRDLASRITP